MAIQIQQIAFLNEKGKRKNNEDNILPAGGNAASNTNLFLVCDGVGGANKGEVASLLVCQYFDRFFKENPDHYVDAAYLQQALRFVESKLSEHAAEHAECSGMATTLTLLYLDHANNRAVVAWCGDSRVYHIRDKAVLYVTSDHSLVNELVKRGEITAEEAHRHPQRNVILRAISGKESPTNIDVYETNNLQKNDYFLLCSDGILESIDERILTTLLPNVTINLEQKKELIREMCDMNSNDNFSMYLIELGDISPITAANETTPLKKATGEINKPISSAIDTAPINSNLPPIDSAASSKFVYLLVTAAILVLGVLGFLQWKKSNEAQQLSAQIDQAQTWSKQNDLSTLQKADSLLQQLKQQHPNDANISQLLEELTIKIATQKNLMWQEEIRNIIQQKWNHNDDSIVFKRLKYSISFLDSLARFNDSIQLQTALARIDSAVYKRDSIKNTLKPTPKPAVADTTK